MYTRHIWSHNDIRSYRNYSKQSYMITEGLNVKNVEFRFLERLITKSIYKVRSIGFKSKTYK